MQLSWSSSIKIRQPTFLKYLPNSNYLTLKIPSPYSIEMGFFYPTTESKTYFSPAILFSIVSILDKASASFCLSFAKTFSGAPFTNFSFANLF